MGRSRSRSRSPKPLRESNRDRRDRRDRSRRNDGGFRWKERRKDTTSGEGEKRLERGYRTRSRSPRRESKGNSVEDKFGVTDKSSSTQDKKDYTDKQPQGAPASTSAKSQTAAATYGEPMIIVHVNDRLGTKAAIPCLASDPIKLFKAQVAARIGRKPHEILLKRQGERPFKDQLTLEDYGISNGVQLDLEIDTGD